MNPEITIKLVQDMNWWVLGIQAMSALAIIVAAIIAATYPKQKDKRHRQKMEVYFYSLLKQLKSKCDTMLFLGEVIEEITEDTYVALINEISSTNDLISINFLEAVESCPSGVIEKIHLVQLQVRSIFLDLGDYKKFHDRFDDSIALVKSTWTRVLPDLNESIAIIEKDIEAKKGLMHRLLHPNRKMKPAESDD